MNFYNIKKVIGIVFTLNVILFNMSCQDFIDVDGPHGQIPSADVFENEITATAAVSTLYSKLRDNTLLTGSASGLTLLMGFYTDELDYYSIPGTSLEAFHDHQITASNDLVKSLWDDSYKLIYMSNSAIEKLDGSQNLIDPTKNQLKGEALFIRALTHFYLVNLFGEIPYISSTDYLINQDVTRTSIESSYDKIVSDLLEAEILLPNDYISDGRTRANRYVVNALLARTYLYRGDWANAVMESSKLINEPTIFHLENDLNDEFLINSSAAILQLKPKLNGENTKEAGIFLFEYGPPLNASLNSSFVDSFEQGDLRKTNWIKEVTDGTDIWYAPYKYKAPEYTGTTVEYSMLLRLSEQYLIRAEARAHLGDYPGAIQDINFIRNRAGLDNIDAGTEGEILQAVLNERKFELFTEHGHRWFDLKRFDLAETILSPLKPNWRPTDALFPIPETELLINPNLAPQNPGY